MVCTGLSLQWLLLLQSTGCSLPGLPKHIGLAILWHVGSSLTRDQTCVPCIDRRIPNTVPPESPCHIFFIHSFVDCHLSCLYGFSGSSDGKQSTFYVGDLGSIPVLGRSPGEGKDCPLPYSGMENSMDVHGVTKSRT